MLSDNWCVNVCVDVFPQTYHTSYTGCNYCHQSLMMLTLSGEYRHWWITAVPARGSSSENGVIFKVLTQKEEQLSAEDAAGTGGISIPVCMNYFQISVPLVYMQRDSDMSADQKSTVIYGPGFLWTCMFANILSLLVFDPKRLRDWGCDLMMCFLIPREGLLLELLRVDISPTTHSWWWRWRRTHSPSFSCCSLPSDVLHFISFRMKFNHINEKVRHEKWCCGQWDASVSEVGLTWSFWGN